MTPVRRIAFAIGLVALGCVGFVAAALDVAPWPWRSRRGR